MMCVTGVSLEMMTLLSFVLMCVESEAQTVQVDVIIQMQIARQ